MLFFIARYGASPATTTNPQDSDFFVHTMQLNDISTLLSKALKISNQYLANPQTHILWKFVRYLSKSSLPFFTTSKTASIKLLDSFKTRWLTQQIAPPHYTATQKPSIYDASIRYNKKALVWVRKESIHKAHIRNFINYEATERETGKLVFIIIKDIWFRKLKWYNTYCTIVTEGQLPLTSKQRVMGNMPLISSHCKTRCNVTISKSR